MVMLEEIIEEAKDFFEDIFEHLFEKETGKKIDTAAETVRTQGAYHFTERVDSLIKVIFGVSILISALVASVWGFVAVGDMVRELVSSLWGRGILIFIGVCYVVNGLWRMFHAKN